MKLSDLAIKNLRAGKKDRFVSDGGGLYLRVHPTGTKTFVFRSQAGGATWTALGTYPTLSLAAARLQAANFKTGGVVTVAAAAKEHYERILLKQYARPDIPWDRIKRDVLPTWGERLLGAITRKDVTTLLQKIVDRGSPVAANRTLSDIQHLFDYAVQRGWLDTNPASGVTRRVIGGQEKSRERALALHEIGAFCQRLRSWRSSAGNHLALALLLTTGQRATEVLRVSQADIAGCWWTIPKERTKSRRAHKVYLSPQSRAILRAAFTTLGPTPFTSDHRALSRAVARLKFDPPFTPHDLRRTFASHLADAGIAPHVIEKCLNHQMEGVMAVYNRAEYLEDRKKAWRLWGATLAQLRRNARRELNNAS